MMEFGGNGGAITLYYRNAAHVVTMAPLSRRFVNGPLLQMLLPSEMEDIDGAVKSANIKRTSTHRTAASDSGEVTLWVNFCRAISRNARLLYLTKLPRRPFAV
jgi:hypothetical protein